MLTNKIFRAVATGISLCIAITAVKAQQKKDSTDVKKVENLRLPDKVFHAEPLYIDLIRDLGARKGEREWNVGFGLTDNMKYDEYMALVEYEWAPLNRLGLEIELPFLLYYPNSKNSNGPRSKLNSLKMAGQYSFYVSEKNKTSMAIGYIHEFELNEMNRYSSAGIFTGNVYNPFFVAAKRWGSNFHTLLYTGPAFTQHVKDHSVKTTWQINSSFHYMISKSRNFIGIEFNKELHRRDFDMTVRPQMRVELSEHLMIGIVTGVPIRRENERFSSFLRLIYEPKQK